MKGSLLINFMSLDGIKIIAQYYLILLRLQSRIEEILKSDAFDAAALSESENIQTRLIVKVAHDSLVATRTILHCFIAQGKE